MQQLEKESRRLWRYVTLGLKQNKLSMATNAKRALEQQQRDEAKLRQVIFKCFIRKSAGFDLFSIM